MKKIYITPALTDAHIELKKAALDVTASDYGIGSGGEDPGVDPESKQRGFGHSILDGDNKKDLW